MTPERERQIERICDGALECPPAERDRFLADACGGDQSLRVQVDLLLAQEPRAASFLETPALLVAGRDMGASPDDTTKGFARHAPLDDARFAPGEIFASRHRIVSLLGRGAMGEVYRADDLKLGQPVALKLLAFTSDDGGGRLQRFITEVRHARTVGHPNVCRVYDIGEADGWCYISMELVDGETLESLLRRIGRLPVEKTLDIARQLCAGLAAAHDRGVLHRDLKPSNIMVDGRGQVRILDFGLAVSRTDWTIGEIAGTPAYMAPEQVVGDRATEQTDLYALGLILYELHAGRPLLTARTTEERRRIHDASVVPALPGIDPAVDRIIRACLERDPLKRPASALAVASLLPGGDPLAAAMAKGMVLSPEMIAAAGPRGALHPAHAWALLGAVLIGILAGATQAHVANVAPADVPKPPEVLAERARNILAAIGGGHDETDSASWFAFGPSREVRFDYRLSPRPLVPRNLFHMVTEADPPADVPGMAALTLDPSGRLIGFTRVVEHRTTRTTANPPTVDWTALFREAGLDDREFVAVEPAHTPSVTHDARFAWDRTSTAASPRRVTAAALEGNAVQFDTTSAGRPADTIRAPWSTGRSPTGEAALWAIIVATFLGGAALARHNLRLGRGDRLGARRLGILVIGLGVLSAILRAHHVPIAVEEVVFLFTVTGWALLWGGLTWLVYLSLEPYLRRVWPRTLISWARLLSGQVRDPLVGRDVLIGMCAGIVQATLVIVRLRVGGHAAPADTLYPALESLESLPHFANIALVYQLANSFQAALISTFVMLLLRLIVRKTWIVVGIGLVLGLPFPLGGSPALGWELVVVMATLLLAFTVFLRVGLLAQVAMMFTDLLVRVPLTLDMNAWYFGNSLVVLLVLAALAVYGFLVSLGGRPAFGTNAV